MSLPLNVEYRPVATCCVRPQSAHPQRGAGGQHRREHRRVRVDQFRCWWTASNGLIAGHGRLGGARGWGWTEVPGDRACASPRPSARPTSSPTTAWRSDAGWDEELLALELGELLEANFDLALTGFGEAEIEALLADEPHGRPRLSRAMRRTPPMSPSPRSRRCRCPAWATCGRSGTTASCAATPPTPPRWQP